MNKIYRVVFNSATGTWVAASELARGRTKKASRSTLVVAAGALLMAGPATAQTVALPVFDPTINDNQVGSTVVSGGANVTLQGPATQIIPGITGRSTNTLPEIFAAGLTTDPRANPADPASIVINTGAKTRSLTVPDPITGGTRTVAVYDNASIVETRATSVALQYLVDINGPTNGRQYIDARIGEVDSTGGTLNVLIGTPGGATDAATNFIDMGMAKQTSLVFADGTGTAPSTVVWQGSNRIDMGLVVGAIQAAGPGNVESALNFTFHSYTGAFTAFDGSAHVVNSASDLQAYNTFLIGRLQAGALNPVQYEAQFARAFTATTSPLTYLNGPPLPDEAYEPIGVRTVIQADGTNAQGVVAAGARIDSFATGGDSLSPILGSVMLGTNGGTVTNNGQISVRRSGNDGLAGMVTQSGGHAINNGVVNTGFLSGLAGAIDPPIVTGTSSATGIQASGAGSTFVNNASGVVNVAHANGRGVWVFTGGVGSNQGTINVGVANVSPTAADAAGRATGALIQNGGQFTNASGALIYLGRQPQYASGSVVPDIGNNVTPLTGLWLQGNGSAVNEGTITIGSLTQGSAGLFTTGATGALVNNGVININGAAGAAPVENHGISVQNSTNVSNVGTINVNGVFGIGLKLLSGNATAALSSGTINVTGGIGPTGLRNYGIWSEGTNSVATLSGNVNLSGVGGIGVHARGGGDVNVTGLGNVNFLSGSNQIGYFLHGAGSTVNYTGTAGQDVSTTDSTLFRIEDGAVFSGGTAGSVFTASGTNATAFNITGAPSTFNSGNLTLNLSGEDAKGVLIEGGAVGTITGDATINQTGVGSVAGIVDGQKHGLDGAPVGAPIAATTLTSSATLNSALDEVTGYIARNQGQLTNSGNLAFTGAHTTGIQVETGATATNSASIAITDGGTGIRVAGPAGGLATTANNSGTITVNGGSTADRTRGVVADGPMATANMLTGSTLELVGVGAIGAEALNGGTVTVAGTALPVFADTDQIAFHALGAGSTVANTATALDATGVRSTLFRIEDGATLATDSALTASGQGSTAIVATGVGAQADLTGGSLDITGTDARGILVEGGATGTIGAGTAVTLVGPTTVVGVADGQKHDLSGAPVGAPDPATTLTNLAAMSLYGGSGAVAFIAQNQGTLLNQGTIEMTALGTTGVHVLSGGVLDNQADITIADGTGIDLEGANSQVRNSATVTARGGVAALHVHDGGGGVVGGTFVSDGTAHTVLVGTGATGLDVTDVTLTSNGSGHGIENAAEIAAITLANTTVNVGDGAGIRTATALDPASTVTVNVSGAGTGFAFQTATGGAASGDLDLGGGYVINGNGAGSTGILANTSGTVTTAANVTMTDPAAGAALVAGTTAATTNTGTLTSASTVAPVVDLSNGTGTTFTNAGTITAADVTATAVLGSDGADTVNLAGGAVTGVVATGDGSDTLAWTGGTLNGSLEVGAADDALTLSGVDLATTYHVDGGTGTDVLTLAGVEHRGGSFAADDLGKGVNLGQDWETINLSNGTGFTLTDNVMLSGSTLNIDGSSTLFAGAGVNPVIGTPSGAAVTVNNAGTIDLTNGSSGPTDVLTINGAYVGQGGRLRLDTVPNEGGANTISDRLVTQTSLVGAGPTAIEVVHDSATGALTVDNGILLVDVAGQSDAGAFTLGNRVVGGAYEYLLFQGGLASNGGDPLDGNWYLRNVTDEPVPEDPPPPPLPPTEPPVVPEPPTEPPVVPEPPTPDPEGPEIPILRPEAAVYLANQAAATGMYVHTLHDRLGEVDYSERQRGGDERHRGAWGRVQRDQFDTTAGQQDQVDVGTDTSLYQVGGEMGRWTDGEQRWHWGLMGGYGEANTHAVSKISGFRARGKVTGYHLGVYGTWFQSAAEPTGLYVDSWLMYGQNNHSVKGDLLPRERYDSSTWTGSVEAGYAMELGRGEHSAWYLEPQAQVIYTNYSDGDHVEANGTVEQARDAGGLTTRLGARIYPRPLSDAQNRVQPFVEANWWHSNDDNTIAFNGVVESMNTGRDTYEVKVGAQAELGGGWTGWGHLGVREADGDTRNVEGLLGLKYGW